MRSLRQPEAARAVVDLPIIELDCLGVILEEAAAGALPGLDLCAVGAAVRRCRIVRLGSDEGVTRYAVRKTTGEPWPDPGVVAWLIWRASGEDRAYAAAVEGDELVIDFTEPS